MVVRILDAWSIEGKTGIESTKRAHGFIRIPITDPRHLLRAGPEGKGESVGIGSWSLVIGLSCRN